MKINEANALKLFDKQYPKGYGYDFAGRKVTKIAYGCDTEYGWDVDHILPVTKGGTDDESNLECINKRTNQKKANHTTWQDAGKTWQVVRVKGNRRAHKVVEIKQGE